MLSSEPLFRLPEEGAKVDSPGKAEETREPPAKRARTSEDESPALLGVPFDDEGLSVEPDAYVASEMENELLADAGTGQSDADEEAEGVREIMHRLRV